MENESSDAIIKCDRFHLGQNIIENVVCNLFLFKSFMIFALFCFINYLTVFHEHY